MDAIQAEGQAARLLVLGGAIGFVEIDFTAAQILRELIRRV